MQIMFKGIICSSVFILMIWQPCGAADDWASSSFDNPARGNVSNSWGQDVHVATYSCDDRNQMDEQTCNGTQWTESELACISNEQIETAHGTNEPEPTDESESYDEPEFPDEARTYNVTTLRSPTTNGTFEDEDKSGILDRLRSLCGTLAAICCVCHRCSRCMGARGEKS